MKKSSAAVPLLLIGSALILAGCTSHRPTRRDTAGDTRRGAGYSGHGYYSGPRYYGGGYHYTPVRPGGGRSAPGASPRGGFGGMGHAAAGG